MKNPGTTGRGTLQSQGVPIILIVLLLTPLLIYPFGMMIADTFGTAGLTLDVLRQTLTGSTGRSAIWGTLWLSTVTVLVAVPVAVSLAWVTALTDAPLARRLALLPVLSLAVPPLVGTIGWLILLSPQAGLLNVLVRDVFGLEGPTGPFNAFSLPVIVMLMVLYAIPYIYGPVYGAFRKVDANLLEAARVSGSGGFKAFRQIILPVVRPAILAGALIGGVMAASNFVIPLVLASGTGLRVIPTFVYQLVNQQGDTGPAVILGLLLTVLTIAGMLLYLRAVGRGSSFTTITGKGLRVPKIVLGRRGYIATAGLLGYLVLAIVLPMLCLAYMSLTGYWSGQLFDQPLSLRQYPLTFERPFAWTALGNSAWLGAAGATLAVTFGLTIAAAHHARRSSRVLSGLSVLATLPMGVPAIVVGIAFLTAYSNGPVVLYGTPLLIVLAYCIHQLPIGLRNADSALRQVAGELDEAARMAGARPVARAKDVYLPLLRQPLLAAWATCFIILFRDLPITVLLYTPQTIVSSIGLLNIFEGGSMPGTAAYAVAITLVSMAGVVVVGRVVGRGEGGRIL